MPETSSYKKWLRPECSETTWSRTTEWRKKKSLNNEDNGQLQPLSELLNLDMENDDMELDDNIEIDAANTDDLDGNTESDTDLFDHLFVNDDVSSTPEQHLDSENTANENDHDDDNIEQEETSDLNHPLYKDSNVTLGQSMLILISFILSNHMKSSTVKSLLAVLSLLLPAGNILPKTKFLFDKYFKDFKKDFFYIAYCPICLSQLCSEVEVTCNVCNKQYVRSDLLKNGNYFIYMPLESQLRGLLERKEIYEQIGHRFNRFKQDSDSIEDIYDGKLYKNLNNGRLLSDKDALSITFNTDGVPIFKSSNYSIWPLQAILNELPMKLRVENVLLLGIWFGSQKPVMTTFLKTFTDELNSLTTKGMKWWNGTRIVLSHVFPCVCSCDSVARCILQNLKQFNGEYGCTWCYNPGEVVERGRGYCRTYKNNSDASLRTHSEMISNARSAFRNNSPSFGVKGPTQLVCLPNFDLVNGFVVDNLHCVDLGVARQLGHLWFDRCYYDKPFYIGKAADEIDKRLQKISPPNEITRLPRSLSTRTFWKGSEWHYWLLFYSPVVLKDVLPIRFLEHLHLLTHAYFLLSKHSISQEDISTARNYLFCFVENFPVLYGDAHVSYNVHQLLHLPDTVINWGPLSCYSSYIFEGFNMHILKLYHGTQDISKQVANTFLLHKAIIHLNGLIKFVDEGVSNFITLSLKGYAPLKKARQLFNFTFLGASISRLMTPDEKLQAERLVQSKLSNKLEVYFKAFVNGHMLYSKSYSRNLRRNNYVVGLSDKTVAEILYFGLVTLPNNDEFCLAFIRVLEKNEALRFYSGSEYCCQHVFNVNPTDFKAIQLSSIVCKYASIVSMFPDYDHIICRLPNPFDRD